MDMYINNHSLLQHYGLQLESCYLSPAVRKRQLHSVPGADGQEDLLKGMGPPTYEVRSMRATFQLTAADPRRALDRLTADIEGQTLPFDPPGDPEHYMVGDFHITSAAVVPGGQVVITATCEPWRYLNPDTVLPIPASAANQEYTWGNWGRRNAVPTLQVEGEICITQDGVETVYPPGTYVMPDLLIPACGYITVTIRGGPATVTYKEAIL